MRFRAPVVDDGPGVLAVLLARDMVDLGMPDYALDDLYDAWRASSFDLAADAIVAETDAGAIVGYAAVQPRGTQAMVAPDYEGRGIGARLLEWSEQRDRELGRTRHRQGIASGNTRARELLLQAGYEPNRSYWRLERQLADLTEPDTPGPGLRLRPLSVQSDLGALHALREVSFAGNADYRPVTLADFRGEHFDAHDFDPRISLVAEHADSLVGFLLARRWDEESIGFVDLLGVHPDHRGRGLATTMLQTAFARFASAGIGRAQLGVASDNRGALRLYERSGMSPRFRIDTYERPVGAVTARG